MVKAGNNRTKIGTEEEMLSTVCLACFTHSLVCFGSRQRCSESGVV